MVSRPPLNRRACWPASAIQFAFPHWVHILLLTVGVCAGMGCEVSVSETAVGATTSTVRLSSGIPGASFHPMGAGLAAGYERVLKGVTIEVQESPGSVRNVQALQQGTADIGFAFSDVAYVAYVGRLAEDPTPFNELRGIAVLQLTPLHLMVRANSGIRDPADLKGRRVATGPPGSGTALISDILMRAFDLSPQQVIAETLPFNEAARRLVNGTLDAAFVSAGYPSESVGIATRAGATILPVDGPRITRLRSEHPFLRLTFVPGGMYSGHPASIPTIGVDALLLCRADMNEDLVYELTRAFFEILPELSAELASLQLMDVDRASATPIPLHRGAARYYRERELAQ